MQGRILFLSLSLTKHTTITMFLNKKGNRSLINNESEGMSTDELMSEALSLFEQHTSDEIQASDGELMQGIMSDIMSTENNKPRPHTPGRPLWAYAEADDKCPVMKIGHADSFWDYEL